MASAALPRRELSVLVKHRAQSSLHGTATARTCCLELPLSPGRASRRPFSASPLSSTVNRMFYNMLAPRMSKKPPINESPRLWDECKQMFHFAPASPQESFQPGSEVTVHGFLGKRRNISAKVAFVDVTHPGQLRPVQVRSAWEVEDSPEHALHRQLKGIVPNSAVSITGQVEEARDNDAGTASNGLVRVTSIQVLNPFPRRTIVSHDALYPPNSRHMQLRFSEALRRRLAFRSDIADWSRRHMTGAGFREFETPVLFKSTPEGAREFIVPTRERGYAYALPQSPQQFKQILMASGVAGGYFQFARCFRDEDLRADRQPEFTQLDLEMAFATGEDVMQAVERYTKELVAYIGTTYRMTATGDGDYIPIPNAALSPGRESKSKSRPFASLSDEPFLRMPYDVAMAKYGSDKPDLRIPGEICRLDDILPPSFKSMITSLENPIVDAWRFRLEGSPEENRKFVTRLLDSLFPKPVRSRLCTQPIQKKNPDDMPAVMVYDSSKPLCGLAPLGHEAFDELTSGKNPDFAQLADFEEGDILFLQTRKRKPLAGGSTALGRLRIEAYRLATEGELLPRDDSLRFLWVVGFPMFTPSSASRDPGQGGEAGFSATHHPFTAPLTEEDFDLLATDPLRAKADHYDLVVNGVELGGGSRRIHLALVQEFIMREILKMDESGINHFSHLLAALRVGCPPHAGFAFGFDRLTAVLSGTTSVRDVIAFPKSMKGVDPTVRSPAPITDLQFHTYNLALSKLPKIRVRSDPLGMR